MGLIVFVSFVDSRIRWINSAADRKRWDHVRSWSEFHVGTHTTTWWPNLDARNKTRNSSRSGRRQFPSFLYCSFLVFIPAPNVIRIIRWKNKVVFFFLFLLWLKPNAYIYIQYRDDDQSALATSTEIQIKWRAATVSEWITSTDNRFLFFSLIFSFKTK